MLDCLTACTLLGLKVQLKEHTLWHFDLFTHEGLALHLLTPPATGVAYVLLLMQLTAADSAYVRANANAAAEGMHGTQAQGPGHISSAVSCSTALCFKFMDAAGGQAFEGLLQASTCTHMHMCTSLYRI